MNVQSIDTAVDPSILYQEGIALLQKGERVRARASFERAVSVKSDLVEARFKLAQLDAEDGRTTQAIDGYRTCIRMVPGLLAAYNNLGLVFKSVGNLEAAIACFQKCIELKPTAPEAYSNLGAVSKLQGRMDLALSFERKAVALAPDRANAHYNIGLTHMARNEMDAAQAAFAKAISLRPDFSRAYNNMGIALKKSGRTEAAIDCFENAFSIDPENTESAYNLGKLLQDVCDWRKLDDVMACIHRQTRRSIKENQVPAEEPFFNLARSQDPKLNFSVAQCHSATITKRYPPLDNEINSQRDIRSNKITIGYLSNGFGNHPTAHLMVDLFGIHNREKFRIHCYSYGSDRRSVYRRKIEAGCDRFVDIAGLGVKAAAKRIRADGVDILVDLKGHTSNSRLGISAMRPAPLQVRYLGMAGTTGASFFDYLLTDETVTPKEHLPFYSEKPVYLPNCYQVNSDRPIASDDAFKDKRGMGLPENGIVFAAFLAGYKIDRQLFDRWTCILKRVPGSVLWLWERDDCFRRNLTREAETRGLDPRRIVFAKEFHKPQHLARLGLADVCLDTRHVNGAATTSDALWAGVPVITVKGRHFASRMSASILAAVGLAELITPNLDQYEELAVGLASDPRQLKRLRERLARNRTSEPLFDARRFVRNLENAFMQIWAIYRSGEKPRLVRAKDSGPGWEAGRLPLAGES